MCEVACGLADQCGGFKVKNLLRKPEDVADRRADLILSWFVLKDLIKSLCLVIHCIVDKVLVLDYAIRCPEGAGLPECLVNLLEVGMQRASIVRILSGMWCPRLISRGRS